MKALLRSSYIALTVSGENAALAGDTGKGGGFECKLVFILDWRLVAATPLPILALLLVHLLK
jgi:hypothetical protein